MTFATADELLAALRDKFEETPLKRLLSRELQPFLEKLPPGVSVTDFGRMVSRMLADELCVESDRDPPPATENPSASDFHAIYSRILHDVRLRFIGNSLQMLKALGAAVALRDSGDSGHNYRVTIYAVRLAEALGCDEARIRIIIKGSFLHDIGKISIPDTTLKKDSGLTAEEFAVMRNHVLMGLQMVKGVLWLEDAADIVIFHHERWDGQGYLSGLRGEAIPYNARLFTICDAFDALTSRRRYKEPIPLSRVLALMENDSAAHFDPDLLSRFREVAAEMYDEVARAAMPDLDRRVTELMNRYFGVDPEAEELRSRHSEA